jgi:hypothetical protein
MDDVRSNPQQPKPPTRAEAAAETYSQGGRKPHGAEKRGSVRYAVCADAIIVEVLSSTCLTGRAADLSLGGCYLDGINLFPVAASVRLRLTTEVHSFECEARVTYSVPSMGMGLVFTKTSSDQAAELRNWIAELSGEPSATPPVGSDLGFDRRKPTGTENFGGSQGALSELITILRRKGLLDESEVASVRNKLAR